MGSLSAEKMPDELQQAEKVSSFWERLQIKHITNPLDTLQEAALVWGVPVLARLPDTDGPFYTQYACEAEDGHLTMSWLDAHTDDLTADATRIRRFSTELPPELIRLYPNGLAVCQLHQNDLVTGYIAFGGTRELNPLDDMFLLNLRGILDMQFSSDQYTEINKGIAHTVLFRVLLEGKADHVDLTPVERFIEKLPKSDIWNNRIMIVESGKSTKLRLQFLRETCNTMVTCSLRTIYDGRIVLLYHGRNKYPVQEHHVFTEYLRSNDLRCAVSRTFSQLDEMPKYYAQAIAALELGPKLAPDRVLYTYEECVPFHMIQLAAQTIGISEMQSPRLLDLKQYDRDKGTELLKTLRIYLENINDVSASAAKLAVHRNTLFHRLRKIEEITQWDLNSGKQLRDISFFLRVMDLTDYI